MELKDGRETPEPSDTAPDADLDWRNVPAGRTEAARPDRRATPRQRTGSAPEHYQADNLDARTPPGTDTLGGHQPVGPALVQGIDRTMAATRGAQDPAPLCNICGDTEHAQEDCTVDQGSLQCNLCNSTGHAAVVCPENQPPWSAASSQRTEGRESGPLSESTLGVRVPPPPGDALAQRGATGEVYKTSSKRKRISTTTSPPYGMEGHKQEVKAQTRLLPYSLRQPQEASPNYRTPTQFPVPLHR